MSKRDTASILLAACCISVASILHDGLPSKMDIINKEERVTHTVHLRGDNVVHTIPPRAERPEKAASEAGETLIRNVPVGAEVVGNYGKEYIIVSKVLPETLYLIYKGKVVFESKANTGIPQSPTPDGEFHVYRKYWSTTMSGFNPATREWYDDPGVKYAMYFHYGDAIHAFPRKGYGWPQSLGCVELPLKAAGWLFLRVKDGTNVIVENSRPEVVADAKPKQ